MTTSLTFAQRVDVLSTNNERGLGDESLTAALETVKLAEQAIKEVAEEGSTEFNLNDLAGAIELINTAPTETSI